MICPNCQKEIASGAKFCKFCGKEIVSAVDSTNAGSVDLYFQNKQNIEQKSRKKLANSEMLKGLIFIILGIAITGISYAMATDGGTYRIFWGLSIYGGYIFLKSFSYR